MFVTPRKASTVALIRDNSGKLEVLLMRRHLHDRFLPDYNVFPGGALDEQDYDYQFPENKQTKKLKDFTGSSKEYYGNIICGIRETFEECGLLLAVDKNGNYPNIHNIESLEKFSLYRKLVFEQRISFHEMLTKENLYPAINNFFYMNRWVTPVFFPIRYDAVFFAVIAPVNQEISHDDNELVDFQWITPGDALHDYKTGKIKLVTPTIKTIEFLKKFKLCSEVLESLCKSL